ncbi:VWA domain-containing protein [uncultured Bifidobacterium sp.]|uniref:vWA domain-containing protein n=1 Tax=uncultured Bifidobacterium sp. TaxID=165187 RepID=UPI00261C7306|nr:VWA domain-containing protein [uncultured Bifidobacterium sp.]
MSAVTFSPALGWPVGSAIAAVMVLLAIVQIVLWRKSRNHPTDVTAGSIARRSLICLAVALAALTPLQSVTVTSSAVKTTDVVIAVDVTGSMAVSDAHYGSSSTVSRLSAASSAVKDITGLYPDSSFAGISFGSSATVDVPLTPDTLAISEWAQGLTVEPTSTSSGSSLDTPLDLLLRTLKSIHDQHPQDQILLYLITDGENTSSTTRRTYSSLRAYLDDAFVLGVGSTTGGHIPRTTTNESPSSSTDDWVIDPTTGKAGISRMDSAELESIADEMGGTHVLMTSNATAAKAKASSSGGSWRTRTVKTTATTESPIVWPIAAALLILTLWELLSWLRTSRRLL